MSKGLMIRSTITIILFTLASKFIGLFRESLIAANFGTTYATDIYIFSIGMVSLLYAAIGNGLTTTFIPMFTDYKENKSIEETNYFVNNIISIVIVLTFVLTILGVIFGYNLVYYFGPGFRDNPAVFSDAVKIVRIMIFSLVFMGLQSIYTGVLQSHKEFKVPAISGLALNATYVIYLLIFAGKYGIIGFAIATIVAYMVQLSIQVPKFKELGYNFRFIIDLREPGLRKMIKLMVPALITTSVIQVNLVVDRFLASKVYQGAIAGLGFADKINSLVFDIFGIAISTVVYPNLSSFSAKENKDEFKATLTKSINAILLIMVPASIGLMVLRLPVIDILFKRGAFDTRSSEITATALLFYAPAMIFYAVRDIMTKAFYSIKETRIPMINSILGVLLNIVLNLALVGKMKVGGLALATSASATLTTILLIITFNKKINGMGIEIIGKTFVKILAAGGLMGVVVYISNKLCIYYIGSGFSGSLISLAVSVIIGAFSYFAIVYMFKLEEFIYIVNIAKEKLKRK